MRHRRTKKEMKQSGKDHYAGLANKTPEKKALEEFKRPVYSAGKQSDPLPRLDVLGYMELKRRLAENNGRV